jgi:hypothetical protein
MLLDAVFVQQLLGALHGGAGRNRDQVLPRHDPGDLLVGVAHEAQVAVGQDADGHTVARDGNTRDPVPPHHLQRLVDALLGPHRDRVHDHARLGALHLVHLAGLGGGGQVLVDHADAAVLRHADRRLVLGDRVHGRGDQRHVQGDLAGELGAEVDLAGDYVTRAGHEQDVVERQCLANLALAHVDGTPFARAPARPPDGRAV